MAVIDRTECFCKSLFSTQGIVLFLVLCGAGLATANPRGCESAAAAVKARGFDQRVLDRPATGQMCGPDSCCTLTTENDMVNYSTLYLDKFWRDSVKDLNIFFDNRAKRFDDFFRNLLSTAKQEFHEMFKRTYGKIYIENSDVFSDFFNELERYYKKGTVRLSETMDTFFGILYQRMFVVINAQYTFDEAYLICANNHMSELKPFGDVSSKLSLQLRRAFVATKMFYKGLQTAVDISVSLKDYKFTSDCVQQVAKMQFCGSCKQEPIRACSEYCSVTMEKCFQNLQEFSATWDSLIHGIEKVAERLLGPYNVEAVVEPINIKISEAIMNFQETGTEVSKKIFSLCGKPSLNRPKRKAEYKNPPEHNPNLELNIDSLKPSNKKKQKNKNTFDTVDSNSSSSLEKIVGDIRMKIRDTEKFFLNLPSRFCINESITDPQNKTSECWMDTSSHQTPIQPSSLIHTQSYVINIMRDNLRKAHNGEEVEMEDDESVEASGSGSGDDGYDEEIHPHPEHTEEPVDFPSSETPPSTRHPEVVRASGGGSLNNKMCLSRALVQYILPIVLAWFGGAITDLL